MFDALNGLLRSAVYGAAVCDRQGKIYFEIEAAAKDSAATSLTTSMFVDNHDWINQPQISERHTNDLSYIEGGGVAYFGYSGGTGTYTPFLACAPGTTPAYRGSIQKLSGFALTSQAQLNTLVGNIYAFQNSTYPEVRLDIAGNYRNFDIAPQELIKLTLAAGDTHRGITWTQKPFVIQSVSWTYDSQHGSFLPQMGAEEITQGFDGDSIAIPLVPPDDGFEQPGLVVPVPPVPVVPVVPVVPIVGGGTEPQYLQCYRGVTWPSTIREPLVGAGAIFGPALQASGETYASGWFMTPPGYTGTITFTPVIILQGQVFNNLDARLQSMYQLWPTVSGGNSFTSGTETTIAIPDAATLVILSSISMNISITERTRIALTLLRDGDDAADTYTTTIAADGWIISYG